MHACAHGSSTIFEVSFFLQHIFIIGQICDSNGQLGCPLESHMAATTKQNNQWLPWFTCKNEGFHDLLVYFISKLSIPWTSMVCATCNSFPRQVTPVWWSYMAHIFLCLFIFPKSNHSSPYDDDVVPGIPGHLPVLGICFLCVSVSVYMFVSP